MQPKTAEYWLNYLIRARSKLRINTDAELQRGGRFGIYFSTGPRLLLKGVGGAFLFHKYPNLLNFSCNTLKSPNSPIQSIVRKSSQAGSKFDKYRIMRYLGFGSLKRRKRKE